MAAASQREGEQQDSDRVQVIKNVMALLKKMFCIAATRFCWMAGKIPFCYQLQ